MEWRVITKLIEVLRWEFDAENEFQDKTHRVGVGLPITRKEIPTQSSLVFLQNVHLRKCKHTFASAQTGLSPARRSHSVQLTSLRARARTQDHHSWKWAPWWRARTNAKAKIGKGGKGRRARPIWHQNPVKDTIGTAASARSTVTSRKTSGTVDWIKWTTVWTRSKGAIDVIAIATCQATAGSIAPYLVDSRGTEMAHVGWKIFHTWYWDTASERAIHCASRNNWSGEQVKDPHWCATHCQACWAKNIRFCSHPCVLK